MASKKVVIGDREIYINLMKVKKIKELPSKFVAQFDNISKYVKDFSNSEGSLEKFLLENYNFITDILLDQTQNFTKKDFEDLDILEAIQLVKEFLAVHGLTNKVINDFLAFIRGATKKTVPLEISENPLLQPRKI